MAPAIGGGGHAELHLLAVASPEALVESADFLPRARETHMQNPTAVGRGTDSPALAIDMASSI